MKKVLSLLLVLFTLTLFTSCESEPDSITVKGTVIGEDNLELTNLQKVLSNLDDCHVYMVETDSEVYLVMTPSTTSDPLDIGFEGTFELGELKATGKSEDYVGGSLNTSEVELRDLISYK